MMKKIIAFLMIALVLITSAVTVVADTPKIKKTEYDGNGLVEVDFRRDVQYKNLKVTVKDSKGKSYSVSVLERDEDDLTFRVKNIKAGLKYTYTISGVRSGRKGSYTSVKGTFKTPAASKKPQVKYVEYDWEDRELEVEFVNRVSYKSPQVTLVNAAGKSFPVRILDRDNDSLELYVGALASGTYKLTISGIGLSGSTSKTTITHSFNVW